MMTSKEARTLRIDIELHANEFEEAVNELLAYIDNLEKEIAALQDQVAELEANLDEERHTA